MRIVIGYDGSRAARTACDLVASRTWPAGTRARLVASVEPYTDWTGMAPVAAPHDLADDLEQALDEPADVLRRAGLAVDRTVESGRAGEVLVAVADDTFADLIVVGSRGLGPAASVLLGSVSAHLVDHAGCPVLVARAPELTRMLLATDGTPSSRSIPSVLGAWGPAFRGLPVEILSVVPRAGFVTPWGAGSTDDELVLREGIAEGVADEMMELGWHTAAAWKAGDPSRVIVAESRDWGADLIVTGSRGIGTLHRLVAGSVAHDVLLHARSSVLVVRGHVSAMARAAAPGFASTSAASS